jgi:hypothetical protein
MSAGRSIMPNLVFRNKLNSSFMKTDFRIGRSLGKE